MRKRLYNGDFSFLLMPLVLSIKALSKLRKCLLVGGQCLDRVMFCLQPVDFNDFSLKLTKYLMFPNNHFCVKICNRASSENSNLVAFAAPVCHILCISWLLSIKPSIKIL